MLQRTDKQLENAKEEIGFYSIKDVSYMTDISEETIRRLCMTGKLKATKYGKCWIITKKCLIDFFSCVE